MKKIFTRFNVQALVLGLGLFLLPGFGWGQTTIASQDFETVPATPTMTFTTSDVGTVGASTGFSSGNSGTTAAPANSNLFTGGARGYRMQGGSSTVSRTLTFSSINTSTFTSAQISFRVAGMSIGSTGNGMDNNAGIDQVLTEVSPDGGTTWYQQSILNVTGSGGSNARWAFSVTGAASRAYVANNTFTTHSINNTAAGATLTGSNAISTVTVTGLPLISDLRVRVTMQCDGANESWIIDDVVVTGTEVCTIPTVITALSATNANTQSVASWTNSSCFDEMMVVAKASSAVSFTPTGDGTAYTANAAFGSGTDVGSSQFVIYKGTGTSVTTTALTNGTIYHFAVYTRKGTTWSAAVTTTATPSHTVNTWTGGNTTWLTTSNWSTGSAPSGTSTEAFFNNNTNTGTIGINMNNIPVGNSSIGAIHWGTSATTARTFNNSSTTAGGTFTLNGLTINSIANTIIRNASSGTHTITNGSSQALNIGLGNTTDNIIAIDGTGGITISSIISGANKLTKAGSGAGILLLTGANTYTGLTTVSAGTLQLNKTGGTTLPETNDVTVAGGTLKVSTNQTLNNLTLTSGSVTVDNGVTLTINGALTLTSGTLTVSAGGTLIIANANSLTKASGTIDASSATATVAFTNSSALALPSNLFTSSNVGKLTLNGAGGVTLGNALTVTGVLTLTSGNLVSTSTNKLTLANGATVTQTSGMVTGPMDRTISAAIGSHLFPIGDGTTYRPVTINFTASPTAGTLTGELISSDPGTPTSTFTEGGITIGNTSPTGYWSIVATTLTGGTYDITVDATGFKKSDNTTTITDLVNTRLIKRASGSGASGWIASGGTAAAPSALSAVSITGLSSFSEFALGGAGVVLPVEITNFNAKLINGKTMTRWMTLTERNNAFFDVQHSTNATSFQTIGQVKGNGTTNVEQKYLFEHENPSVGINYYRLRQVDFDGKETLSNIVSVLSSKSGKVQVYPNPVTDKLIISTDNNEAQTFSIVNLLGQNVHTGQLNGQKEVSVQALSAGTYVLKVGNENIRFVKN